MPLQSTNLYEIVLRKTLIGENITFEDDNGNDVNITIQDITYNPLIDCAFISDGTNKYKINMKKSIFYNYTGSEELHVTPNSPRIKGNIIRRIK
ncbi:MAG: hypothetical protein ACFFKA_10300 [Candidatus Thorarchaeota archaeon]